MPGKKGKMNSSLSFEPRHILCALDFSDLSFLALKYAAVGAREYGAELTVLHAQAFELPRYFVRSETSLLGRELSAAKEGARAYLASSVKEILGKAVRHLSLHYEVLDADPLDAILDAAEQRKTDLIVLGTHGYGRVKRLLLGSVAENVVRHGVVPVFLVRQKEHEFIDVPHPDAEPRLERILCPVNTAEACTVGMQHAGSLAERFHAKLTVFYSMEQKEDESSVTKDVCSWVSQSSSDRCEVETVVRKGSAAEEIIAYAREKHEDLIVLCAQHRPFQGSTFFGRTTELVVRHAPVPVLVVPIFPGP
jgi:nucleotide-binding universal stress UspA family protein